MTRISLVEAYDNRDVIVQIENLKKGKQDKLNAGTGVTIDGNTINVDTTNLVTKTALSVETARLDKKIDDVDSKIPPLASKAELADESARLDAEIDAVDAKIPPLASKAELTSEASRLDARVDAVDSKIPPLASKTELTAEATRLDARIDASNVKIKTNADAILTIEDELGSDSHPGTIYYRITNVEGEVITLKPIVNESIKSVEVEGDASTVYHRAVHNSGVVETDALPVASETKAGVMSAGIYVAINGSLQNLQARMSVLEGVGLTYQLTGLPENPTDAQITEAFRAQYPNVPLSAGIRAADYDQALIWQFSGTHWIQLTNINISQASSTTLGVVKGVVPIETNQGRIYIETDGTMSVVGWDALKALASSAKQSVDNLEPKVNQQSAKITELEGDVASNGTDITALKTTTRDHTSRIESLETSSASLNTRMGTAETDIDNLQASDSQQTAKISALESDMNNVKPRVGQLESDVTSVQTKTSQNTQAISGLSEDLAGKQNQLTAGEGIAINNDVISVIPDEGMTLYQGSLFDLIEIVPNEFKVLKRFGIEYFRYASGQFQTMSYVEVQPFRIKRGSPAASKTNFAAISTVNGANYLCFDSAGSSLTLYSGTFTYTGTNVDHSRLDARQIKTESIDPIVSSGNGAYFRIWT